jgi:hypothetical protein
MKHNFANISLGDISTPQLVESLQLLVIVYFSSALVLRFIFPAFSVERDNAWSLFSAPVSLVDTFQAKAIFYTSILLLLSFAISIIHILILSASTVSSGLFIFYVLVESVVLAVLGLSVGAIFPNFETTDPQALSTSLSGLSFTALALVYGSFGAYMFFLTLRSAASWYSILFVFVSIVLSVSAYRLAMRKLPHIEFVSQLES